MELAKERGVTGIAEWFNHEQVSIDGDPGTISHLRRAMKLGSPRRPSNKAFRSMVMRSPPEGQEQEVLEGGREAEGRLTVSESVPTAQQFHLLGRRERETMDLLMFPSGRRKDVRGLVNHQANTIDIFQDVP